jgi:mannose-6-phosphate isomerase-like protein (cupin superfamily)
MTTTYATCNLDESEDMAPSFGMGEMGEAHFVRKALGAERIGLAQYRMNPGQRIGFGHRHGTSEEVYVVVEGSGRFKVGDDIVDVGPMDTVYCPPSTMREWESGDDGMLVLAFGGHADEEDHEMVPGWWPKD